MAFHIVDFFQASVVEVGHTNFLTLINKGSAAQGKLKKGQHFRAALPIPARLTIRRTFPRAKVRHNPALVVVFQVQGVPLKPALPFCQNLKQLPRPEFFWDEPRYPAVYFQMFKVKKHVQLFTAFIAEQLRLVKIHHNCFADCKAVIAIQHIPAQFPQNGVVSLLALVMLNSANRHALPAVLKA